MDSSYIIVVAAKWAMICVSGYESERGLEFWYQLVSVDMIIVMVFGSILAARRAQCMACCRFVALFGWAYPIPFHLWSKVFLMDPNILSRGNGEYN